MFFNEHLKEYLDSPLVVARKVLVRDRERIKIGLHSRLINIARGRAEADPGMEKEVHGLLIVYGDFSGETVGIRPPNKFPLPGVIGKNIDRDKFVLSKRGGEDVEHGGFTNVLDDLSGIDSAWLVNTDGAILGPGYQLHDGGDAITEDGWGTGTGAAKYYSAYAHVWATYKLSGEPDKIVRRFERLVEVATYDPYDVIRRAAAARQSAAGSSE